MSCWRSTVFSAIKSVLLRAQDANTPSLWIRRREDWHARFPDPIIADAILDRVAHTAYRLQLKGESQRNLRSPLPVPST